MSSLPDPALRIVIQSRLSSSRLPAKALLPLAGLPSVILCAKRAQNTGIDTLLATSDDPGDDSIATLAREHAIPCFRGELNNVLARFLAATRDMPDDGMVVRLTADNMFPDGEFVHHLAEACREQGVDYLATSARQAGLPYGMSAEVFSVGALRAAGREADNAYQHEHVTPWIIVHRSRGRFQSPRADDMGDLSRLRCTLDSFSDYLRLQQVFHGLEDQAQSIPWWRLVERLATLPNAPRLAVPGRFVKGRHLSRLQLGSAQIGMDYGIANLQGRPTDSQARDLLQTAIDHGISHVDTARDYGEAESRIGALIPPGDAHRLCIITKLSPLPGLPQHASPEQVRASVDASVFRSCRELRLRRLPVLLLHRWAHHGQWEGRLWGRLLELQGEDVIGELGVSVYHPEEAIEACAIPAIRHLQLPFNILDRRWLTEGVQSALRDRPDLLVHGRSALLQGLLVLPAERWPHVADADPAAITRKLDRMAETLQRTSRADLCLAYVRAKDWLDSIVLGAETREQLLENIALFQRPPLNAAQCQRIEEELPGGPPGLVNPALWPVQANQGD